MILKLAPVSKNFYIRYEKNYGVVLVIFFLKKIYYFFKF